MARQKLLAADEVGIIFLRYAVLTADAAVTKEAASMLGDLRDTAWLPNGITRLKTEKMSALTSAIVAAAVKTVHGLEAPEARRCYARIQHDRNFRWREHANLLERALVVRCKSDRSVFNEYIGTASAYADLRIYIERAMTHTDPVIVQWACQKGGIFTGMYNGIDTRYFDNAAAKGEPALRRRENMPWFQHATKLPIERQTKVAIQWHGFINIPADGEYTFIIQGDDSAKLLVDGHAVVTSTAWIEKTMKRTLKAGRVQFQLNLYNNSSSTGMYLYWSGPGFAKRRLKYSDLMCLPWQAHTLELHKAIAGLTSVKSDDLNAARSALRDAGGIGAMALRRALTDRQDKTAIAALDQLVQHDDARTADLLLRLILEKPEGPLVPRYTVALRLLAQHLDPTLVPGLLTQLANDNTAAAKSAAAALCAVYDRQCHRDPATFNRLSGDANGFEKLRNYVDGALSGRDIGALDFILVHGAPLAPMLRGWHAIYYKGDRFNELGLQRHETAINFAQNQSPVDQTMMSVRWSGFVRTRKAGEYEFLLYGDNEIRVRINGTEIGRTKGWSGAKKKITMQPGNHAIEVTLRNWKGLSRAYVSWIGPGIDKTQGVDRRWVRTPPWRELVEQLHAAIKALPYDPATPKEKEKDAITRIDNARALIDRTDPASRPLLRHAVRYGENAVATHAVRILADRRDPKTVAVAFARLSKTDDPLLVAALTDGLSAVVDHASPEQLQQALKRIGSGMGLTARANAAVLCAALRTRCDSDAGKFNKLLARPDAYGRLQKYVQKGMAHKDPAVAAWFYHYGSPFAPMVGGFHTRVYAGMQRSRLGVERVDSKIDFGNITDVKYRPVSAQWSGFLRIKKAGDYKFEIHAGKYARLRINGRQVHQAEGWAPRSTTTALKPGLHTIRLDLEQNAGTAQVLLRWQGPGVPFGTMNSKQVRTPVPLSILENLPKAIADMALNGKEKKNAAKIKAAYMGLRRSKDVGAVYLERALNRADSATVAATLANLRDNAKDLGPEYTSWMLKRVKDKNENARQYAGFLIHIYDKVCRRDPKLFNDRIKSGDAFGALRTYVKRAGADEKQRKWAKAAAAIIGVKKNQRNAEGEVMGKKLTIYDIKKLKGKRQLRQVFVLSADEARACEEAGIDMLVTGSGNASEIRHAAPNTFLTVAVGGNSANSDADAIGVGMEAMGRGADAIYTGVSTTRVKAMAREMIPVVGHVGLVPYRNSWYGGMRAIGKTADEAMKVYRDTMEYQDAGAIGVEIEVVPRQVTAEISRRVDITLIGMGAGAGCDVQYLFAMDVLGSHDGHYPRHSKKYCDMHAEKQRLQKMSVTAFSEFKQEVDSGAYPAPGHIVEDNKEELAKFMELLAHA